MVQLAIRAEGEIERAEWILQPDNGTRSMFAQDDGSLNCSIQIDESVNLTPRLVEPYGLENKHRRSIKIRAIEDKPPTVKIKKPSSDTAVRPDDTVRIEFEARDDIGIQRAELVLYKTDRKTGKAVELQRIPHAIDPQKNQRRVRGSFKVDLSKLGLKHGDTVNYRVEAYDRKQLGISKDETDIKQPGDIDPENTKPNSVETGESPSEPGVKGKSDSNPETTADRKSTSNPASSRQTGSSKEKSESGKTNNSGTSNSKQGNPLSSSSTPSDKTPKPDDNDVMAKLKVEQDSVGRNRAQPNPGITTDPKMAPSDDSENRAGSQKEKSENRQPNSPGNSNSKQSNPPNSSSSSSDAAPKPSDKDDKSKLDVPPDSGPQPSQRALDAAKPSSSSEMKLKINQYAGSFAGQARRKLEIAIAPVLVNLRKWLTATDKLLGSVQVTSDQQSQWGESEHQSMARAIEYLEQSIKCRR